MLIELLLKFQRILLLLLQLFFNSMISKLKIPAPPANSDVEYANYNTFKTNCNRAKENLAKAITADEQRGDKTGVITLYKRAIKDLLMALKIQAYSCPANKNNEIKSERQKLSRHLEMAQERLGKLKELEGCDSAVIVPKVQQNSSAVSSSFAKKCIDRIILLKNVNSKFGEEILSTILPTTDIKMRSIEGNASAKLALEESVVLPSLNPKLFTGLRTPSKGILLFGPPGNGKTMLAKAVANECHSTFFNISAATIMSKWVGDGEKMVQALFQMARNAQPSIIFIDEVDSMLCERSENENAAARRVKTEFLIQLDGCNAKSNDRVLILAATNRPFELDEGILRRFPKRIFIDLPDWKARASMIKRTFQETNTRVSLKEKDFEYLASRTEFYSYSDLDALCRTAALIPLRSVGRSEVSKITASDLRPINVEDFDEALLCVKPSLNQENRERLLGFAKKYAQI